MLKDGPVETINYTVTVYTCQPAFNASTLFAWQIAHLGIEFAYPGKKVLSLICKLLLVWWSPGQTVTHNCLSPEQKTQLVNFALFGGGWWVVGGGSGAGENSPLPNSEEPSWGGRWTVCGVGGVFQPSSVYTEKCTSGAAWLEKSFVCAAEWAPSLSSSLTFVATLNILCIKPRVMNQKILRLLYFCYEFLIPGICNSGAQSCSDLKWLENWVRRCKLGGKYFLRDCLGNSEDRKMTESVWFLGLLNSNKNKTWKKVREKC